jgi:hypothetical protein
VLQHAQVHATIGRGQECRVVPIPGIAGGENANARPPGILESSLFTCFMIAAYCSSGAFRCPHSFRVMKKMPL